MRLLPLFDDGAIFRADHGFRIFRCVHAGDLDVVEGLVVADPWDVDERAPIAAPDGRHRVELALACWDVATEVAALRVTFREAKIVRWRRTEPAHATTDSATLAVTDAGTAARLALTLKEFARREAFVEALLASMERSPGAFGRIDAEGGAVFAASTGSDGAFATWFGLDEAGEAACLVVDFGTSASSGEAGRAEGAPPEHDGGGARGGAAIAPSRRPTEGRPFSLKRWKPKHGEPPPRAFGPEFLAWLRTVGARFDEPLVVGPALDPGVVAELARMAGAPAPLELAEYYAHATPLRDGVTLSTWLELRDALPARDGGSWWPVAVRESNAGVVARARDGEIVEVVDFEGGGIYLSGPELRTFFVNQALTLFGDEI